VKNVGFYLRKSISFGGVRFNFSKSGIGVSVGVKGFRVGHGPRGNYIHMGRNGLYYRATLNKKNKTINTNNFRPQPETLKKQSQDGLEFKDIDSADISQIVDSTSEDLLNEIAEKNRKIPFWPCCLLLSFIVPPVGIMLAIISAILVFNFIDKRRKTVLLLYDIDEYTENKLQEFYNSFDEMKNTKAKWHISFEATTNGYKYNAGASNIVKRSPIAIKYSCPKYLKTNVQIPCIPVGKQTLYFFPDRLLIYQGKRVGAVSYDNLQIYQRNQRFIEDGIVPADATIVDCTWQYINKNGGPDKRFSNNRRLPITLYSEIDFTSKTGLNERVQFSKPDVGQNLINQLSRLIENVNYKVTDSNKEYALQT